MSQVYQGGVLYINGLPAAHAGPGGHSTAQEECWVTIGGQKTKQVFTNIAHGTDLQSTTQQIFTNGYPIATKSSFTSCSYGDEGSEGGVKSGTVAGKMRFLSASSNVKYEGSPVVRHSDSTISNNDNTEESTWIQPSKPTTAMDKIVSDPIEDLANPSAVNIELIRNPEGQFEHASIHQCFLVEHQETGHKTYHTFGVFKELESKFLWHGDFLREGTYNAYEVFQQQGNNILQVPLGTIQSVEKSNLTPGLKLVPMHFRRYDDMQSSKEGIKKPYSNCFIYLFKDGFLWREIHVNLLGRLYEVDLPYFKPDQLRYASGELPQGGVLLPLEDAQGKHEFHLAVSHLPWNWQFIQKMGGIDPADKRFNASHILPIEKDEALISKRLQKIEIDNLIASGEICSTIDTAQTEDEITASVHSCQPPESNKDWTVDRDKFKHSRGITHLHNHLAWASLETVSPAYTHPKSPDAKKVTLLPGTAIFVYDDPLGRLIESSEFMVDEHLKYSEYVEKQLETYMLAQLMGQVLDADPKHQVDYLKLFDNNKRLEFMKEFESKRDSYQAMMKEGTVLLKNWFEKTEERGQWDDFYKISEVEASIKSTIEKFTQITENIYGAFAMSPEGITYLREEVKKAQSVIHKQVSHAQKWLEMEFVAKLFRDTLGLLANALPADHASFSKMMKFVKATLPNEFNAKLSQVTEAEFIDHHQAAMKSQKTPSTASLLVSKGTVSRFKIDLSSANSKRMITVVEVEGVPAFKAQNLVSVLETPSQIGKDPLVARLKKMCDSAAFRFAVGGLIIFNTRVLLKKMEEMKDSHDLNGGMIYVMHSEIMRNGILALEMGAGGLGMMTNKIATKKLSLFAMSVAEKLNPFGIIFSGITDAWNMINYIGSGENDLALSHAIGVIGSGAGLVAIYLGGSTLLGILLGATGIILFAISAIAVLLFMKNELESWFFTAIWGNKEPRDILDNIGHSISKFHKMVTLVYLTRVESTVRYHERKYESFMGKRTITQVDVSIKDILFILEIPSTLDCQVELSLFATRPHGLIRLEDRHLKIVKSIPTEQGTRWEVSADRGLFLKSGTLGRIQAQVFEAKTGAFLGEDAYEFETDFNQVFYEHKKVLYESIS